MPNIATMIPVEKLKQEDVGKLTLLMESWTEDGNMRNRDKVIVGTLEYFELQEDGRTRAIIKYINDKGTVNAYLKPEVSVTFVTPNHPNVVGTKHHYYGK